MRAWKIHLDKNRPGILLATLHKVDESITRSGGLAMQAELAWLTAPAVSVLLRTT
jgi:hypothetical protein